MAKERTKLEIVNESPKESKIDPNVLAMVFDTPSSLNHNSNPDRHQNNDKHHDTLALVNHNGHKPTSGPEKERANQPLLEPDRGRQQPPLAGPEVDDLDDELVKPTDATPYPGIDDGLLENGNKPGITDLDDASTDLERNSGDEHTPHEDGVGTEDDALGNRFGDDGRPISPTFPGSQIDVNTYQQKKNLAQGMMDLALLSANANQLRYVLESSTSHPYYYSSLTLITLSIIFQIGVGIGLIMNSRYDVNDKKEICKADKINNMTVLGIFLITIVNVFITSFSVATPTVTVAVGTNPAITQAG